MQPTFQSPWIYLTGFMGASLVILAFLNHLERRGFEGTALGTLVMPFCSGAPNLVFAVVMSYKHGPGREVFINAMVNNITNLSFLIGLPCLIWGLDVLPRSRIRTRSRNKGYTRARLNRLSLSLTLMAALAFAAATYALGRDGRLDMNDGAVLVGLFVFWQCVSLIDVKKSNIQRSRKFGSWLFVDVLGLAGAIALMFYCEDWLIDWLQTLKNGLISYRYIGWLSGWFMVLPNAIPAFYYAAKGRADIVYSSQVGDGHICIPLCVGLFALFNPIGMTAFFKMGMLLLMGMAAFHLLAIIVLGRLPRAVGIGLVALYGFYLYSGLVTF